MGGTEKWAWSLNFLRALRAQLLRNPLLEILGTPLLMLVMTTFVRLVCHQVSDILVPFILMIPCGMVEVVVQLAHAAHSTIHHGFVNNYLSQLMLIWKSDCAHLNRQLLQRLW